ncbi:MAG: transcriptional activator RfaH [Rhizomicrobium sp.]
MDKVIATGARWYVVQTQPHAENRAIANLERQGYEIFCPRIPKSVRHARKVKHVLSPLFPGYLFVNLHVSSEPWSSVNGTFGVSRLIMQGELPLAVPNGIVESIMASVNASGAVQWKPQLHIGQAVRVVDGPFKNFVGQLEQLHASGRVRVLLNLLGRSVSVALLQVSLQAAA